jgi:glycosyltransferase involved in cell wall biosynthesis
VSGSVLHLLGPSTGGIRGNVAFLSGALAARGWSVDVAGPAGVLDGLGDLRHSIDVPAGLAVGRARAARRALGEVAAGYDLVHAHGLKAGWLAASLHKGPPVVLTIHNVVLAESTGRAAPVLRVLERLLPRRVDAVIAVSDEIARRLPTRAGGPTVAIIPAIGRPPRPVRDRDEVRRALGVETGQRLVVTVARLHPQKDLPTLLQAAVQVRRRHPDVRFAVVGEGPQRPQIEAMIADLGLAGIVTLAGPSPNAADEIAAGDLFVLPSLWEGSPLTVSEAMLLDRPVVATAVGAVPELVRDGRTGRLVPPGDAAALAAATADLLDDPAEASRLAAAGSAWARERLDPERIVGAVEAVYRATVGR